MYYFQVSVAAGSGKSEKLLSERESDHHHILEKSFELGGNLIGKIVWNDIESRQLLMNAYCMPDTKYFT